MSEDIKRKYQTTAMALILLLVMGLRGIGVGTDTFSYMQDYHSMEYISVKDIEISLTSEFGFKYMFFFLKKINVPWQAVVFMISLFNVIVFARFIYKYCANIFLGFYFFATMDFFSMCLTGLRQSIAVTIVLLAVDAAIEKKIFKFLGLLVIATSFHYSALVFIPVYFVFQWKYKGKWQLLIGLLMPVAVRMTSEIIYPVIKRFALDKYVYSGYFDKKSTVSVKLELFLIFVLIFCFCCLCIKDKITTREFHLFTLSCAYVACIELGNTIYIAMRLSFYFAFFISTVIANSLYYLSNRKVRYVGMVSMIVLFVVQFMLVVPGASYGIDDYAFFWVE